MVLRKAVIAGLCLVIGAAVALAAETALDGKALFEANCKICHSINYAKEKKDTPEGWKSTVMRMKDQNGCDISSEEAAAIIDHLAKTYPK